jgi:hypothetical protein
MRDRETEWVTNAVLVLWIPVAFLAWIVLVAIATGKI